MDRSLRDDVRVIALIAGGHTVSHFLQLTLPPLFPLLRDELSVSWVALGLISSVFYAVSGLAQPVAGFLVDHFGARRVLLAGMTLFGAAIACAGLAPTYLALLPVAALAGLGNSVFHPADYSILNATVSARRIARAYSLHQVSGNIGWVLAPMLVGLGPRHRLADRAAGVWLVPGPWRAARHVPRDRGGDAGDDRDGRAGAAARRPHAAGAGGRRLSSGATDCPPPCACTVADSQPATILFFCAPSFVMPISTTSPGCR